MLRLVEIFIAYADPGLLIDKIMIHSLNRKNIIATQSLSEFYRFQLISSPNFRDYAIFLEQKL